MSFPKPPLLPERDLKESFTRASGAGGQNVNKVSSCVRLLHIPTGIGVRCSDERFLNQNRLRARELLAEKVADFYAARKLAERNAGEKERRRRYPKRSKEKTLRFKKKRAETKNLRRRPGYDVG